MTVTDPTVSPQACGETVTREELRAEAERWREYTRRAFLAESASRARGPHSLGLSAIGGCTRRAAYALARTPPSDTPPPREGREANLGTYEHEGLLPRLAEQSPGTLVESKVVLRAAGLELYGSIDLDDPLAVADAKTVAAYKLHHVRRARVPYTTNRVQGRAYGLARLQAGRPPRYIVFLYLDRASGDLEPVVEPFTNASALEVIDRAGELRYWSQHPDQAPRADADGWHEQGPGRSFSCDECWFLKRCWGEDATPGRVGAQSVRTDPEIIQALADYDQARRDESLAKGRKAFAEARLSKVPVNKRYGPWWYGRQQDKHPIDAVAAVVLLMEAGETVPWRIKTGTGSGKGSGENPGEQKWEVDMAGVERRLVELGETVPRTTSKGGLVIKLTAPIDSPVDSGESA